MLSRGYVVMLFVLQCLTLLALGLCAAFAFYYGAKVAPILDSAEGLLGDAEEALGDLGELSRVALEFVQSAGPAIQRTEQCACAQH